jgi:hypothetical protein
VLALLGARPLTLEYLVVLSFLGDFFVVANVREGNKAVTRCSECISVYTTLRLLKGNFPFRELEGVKTRLCRNNHVNQPNVPLGQMSFLGYDTLLRKALTFGSDENSWPPLWSSGHSSWLQIQSSWVRFPALTNFLKSSGSGTGSTQPCQYN